MLDPDVVLRSDGGAARPGLVRVLHGAEAVAARAMGSAASASRAAGARQRDARRRRLGPNGALLAVVACTVRGGRIVAIDVLADPERLRELDLAIPAD